jgi:hypothetical protein
MSGGFLPGEAPFDGKEEDARAMWLIRLLTGAGKRPTQISSEAGFRWEAEISHRSGAIA